MKTKPKFTEIEIEELNDLYENFGYNYGVHEAIKFIKKELNLSEIHKISISLRKNFNLKIDERDKKIENKYKNSTLQSKLMKRMIIEDINEKN